MGDETWLNCGSENAGGIEFSSWVGLNRTSSWSTNDGNCSKYVEDEGIWKTMFSIYSLLVPDIFNKSLLFFEFCLF